MSVDISVSITEDVVDIIATPTVNIVNVTNSASINPGLYDLSQFTNTSINPFVRTSGLSAYVPTTRTLTINGTTQDLSANRTFTVSTGITIGTTAITSGTVGRVLFEGTGNVVSQSANLYWDNTNGFLGIGTSTPSTKLHVVGSEITFAVASGTMNFYNTPGANSHFNFINSRQDSDYIFKQNRNGVANSTSLVLKGLTGNVLINTTTDAGYKLDVNGTARVSGLFTVEGASQKIVTSGNTITCQTLAGSVTPLTITAGALSMPFSTLGVATTVSGSTLSLLVLGGASNWNLASGTPTVMESAFGFAPTSGTASFSFLRWNGTINQTGGANGITRGLYIAPTLTSATDFRAIETTAGNVIFNGGNVGIGTSSPLDFNLVVQGVQQIRASASSFGGLRLDSTSIRRRDTGTFSLGSNDVATALNIFSTNNIGINTTTDAGYKLDVNGTARVGASATSGQLYIKGAVGNGQYLYLDNGGADLWTIIGGSVFVIDSSATRILRANTNAQVTINGNVNDASAQLQVESTTRGFLPPRQTQAQRTAIASPAVGLVVFQTDATEGLYVYKSTGWALLL